MNFTCPFCGHHSTVTEDDRTYQWERLHVSASKFGLVGLGMWAVKCPNKDCSELSLSVRLTQAMRSGIEGPVLEDWKLLPESSAKVMPDYVPENIKKSYKQACRIRDLSPEASATLARRALQGMIRDFWGVTKYSLKDEIDAIEEKVDPDTWASIEAVRSVGNIGAHMEKDINIIVDIEPDEAQLLIELVETLIDDWYVARKKRKDRNTKIAALAEGKKKARKAEGQ